MPTRIGSISYRRDVQHRAHSGTRTYGQPGLDDESRLLDSLMNTLAWIVGFTLLGGVASVLLASLFLLVPGVGAHCAPALHGRLRHRRAAGGRAAWPAAGSDGAGRARE